MEKKITKRERFMELRAIVVDNADLVAFIDNEINLLDKKKNVERKPTATQLENEGLRAKILVALAEVDEPKPIKEIQGMVAELNGLSNQRVSRLLKDLVDNGKVVKTYVKKVAHFALA
jgi:DNA-binding MarR family transcriptional regulator